MEAFEYSVGLPKSAAIGRTWRTPHGAIGSIIGSPTIPSSRTTAECNQRLIRAHFSKLGEDASFRVILTSRCDLLVLNFVTTCVTPTDLAQRQMGIFEELLPQIGKLADGAAPAIADLGVGLFVKQEFFENGYLPLDGKKGVAVRWK